MEDRFIYIELEEYLKDKFIFCDCYIFKFKKKRLGLSIGDDVILYIYVSLFYIEIWWQENRGFRIIIFEGRKLKLVEELEILFDLLDLKEYL